MNAKAAVAKDGKTHDRHLHRHRREGTGVHQRRRLREVVSARESSRGHSTGTVTVECPRRSPSRDAAVSASIPTTLTRFCRERSPATIDTARFGTCSALASTSMSSSLAAPSTGGDCSRTSSASPRVPARPERRARGITRTLNAAPSAVRSITIHQPTRGCGSCCVRQCSVPSPHTRSTAWMPTTLCAGMARAMVSSAIRSLTSLKVGTSTTPLAM